MEIKFEKKNKKFFNNLFLIKCKRNISLIFIIILSLHFQSSNKINSKYQFIIYTTLNQIKITIKGTGSQSIINSDFNYKPNKIVYNNEEKSFSSAALLLNSNINTVILKFSSKLSDCCNMFKGCNKITEVDLTNFDASLVVDFHYMFYGCTSLISVDLSNLKTSNCYCTYYMFYDCISLISVNFTGFDSSGVTLMHHMFYNCKSLLYLDLSSFDTTSLTNTEYMFYGCEKLEYINLRKATISTPKIQTYGNMLTNTPNDIIFCVDESKTGLLNSLMSNKNQALRISDCSEICIYKKHLKTNENCCYLTCEECDNFGNSKYHNCTICKMLYDFELEFNGYKNCYIKCDNLFYLDEDNNITCVLGPKCPNEYSKLILDKKQCIKNCTNENEYIYEYKNYCYKACPNGTMELDIMPFFCISICTKEFPFKLIKSDDCVQYCPISDIRSNNCELYYKENNTNIEDKIIYCIQQDLTKGYNTSEVDDGNDVIFDRNSSVYIITSTINQKKESNRPTINLGNCETSLKNFYNITKEEPLYILEIEMNISFMKIPKIEYEV